MKYVRDGVAWCYIMWAELHKCQPYTQPLEMGTKMY